MCELSVYMNHDPAAAALVPLSRILNICDFEPGSEHVLSVVTNLDKEEQRNDCWPRSPGRVHSVHTYCA